MPSPLNGFAAKVCAAAAASSKVISALSALPKTCRAKAGDQFAFRRGVVDGRRLERGAALEQVVGIFDQAAGPLGGGDEFRRANAAVFVRVNQRERGLVEFDARGGTGQRDPKFLVELIEVEEVGAKWPAGTYYAERAADWDGTTDRPVWVRLAMTVKPEEGKVVFDFSESDPQCDFINVPLGQVWSSVTAGFLWCLPPGLSRNKGFFDCMEVITKDGTCLSPVYPASAAAQAVTLGMEITECVHMAMVQVDPKETPGTWGRHVNPLYAGKRRDKIDPRTGSIMEYTAHCFHAVASSGAAWGFDAVDGNGSSPLGGAMVRAPIEVEEWMIPYIWSKYEFLTDSCGHGQWRGGLGTHVEAKNIYDRKVWQPSTVWSCRATRTEKVSNRWGSWGAQEGRRRGWRSSTTACAGVFAPWT